MKVAIAGFTGLIGTHLIDQLKNKGHEIIPIHHVGDRLLLDDRHKDVDAVINLSGLNVMHRWNASFKEHALISRAGTAREINHFYDQCPLKPKVFISASAIGFYGDKPGETLVETSPQGQGFLSNLVAEWEKATFDSPIKRVVAFRLGVVLSHDGGALLKIAKMVKNHLGCIMGDPHAYVSWVHIDDVVKAFVQALERSSYSGIYNLVAEEAVTQERFMKVLGKIYDRTIWMRCPGFIVKLFLGEAASILLNDARVYPKKLKQSEFDFHYADLERALYSLKKRGL